MNLALTYCWKEWRAQRGLLVAYTGLIFSCLCLWLYLAPRRLWFDPEFGVHALTWFVIAGVIGVVGFVVPGLVRSEFTAKDDQFVRRLPGALWPAFWGKSLFLLLATLMMPLLALLFGEVFITSLGQNWDGLFQWEWHKLEVSMVVPWEVYWCGAGLLLVPWIWAAGSWTPGGRLALLAAALLVLLVSIGALAVFRQSPGIEKGIEWTAWLWSVPVGGICVASLSWAVGRRGGGPFRSARVGLLATAVTLLPGATWLGHRVWHYEHPDLQQLGALSVRGTSADGRFAIVGATEHAEWHPVYYRVDLSTGESQRLCGTANSFFPLADDPFRFRLNRQMDHWCFVAEDGPERAYDLVRDEWREIGWDAEAGQLDLSADLKSELASQFAMATPFRAPGGVRVWLDGRELCFEMPDGCVDREPWPFKGPVMTPLGHGLRGFQRAERFDLTTRTVVNDCEWTVSGWRLWRTGSPRCWNKRLGDGEAEACPQLLNGEILGLLDDDNVLLRNAEGLWRFTPSTGELVRIHLPAGMPFDTATAAAPMCRWGSLLERDPDNCIWLRCSRGNMGTYARVNAATLHVSTVLTHSLDRQPHLVSWDEHGVITYCDERAVIERHDLDAGTSEVVFPRKP